MSLVQIEFESHIVIVRLNDPGKRNALSTAMFDALESAIAQVAEDDAIRVMLMIGAGKHFCAGFDLAAAVDEPALMGQYIQRLSQLNRSLRRLPQVVVMGVQGAAIAGGCALVTAADFVVAAPEATFGYPVHQIGVSPAVTIPTLEQKLGAGGARALTMGGELIDGSAAHQIGLITHLATSSANVCEEAHQLARDLAAKPPHALRITKAWLNELDGSLDEDRFTDPAEGSIELAAGQQAAEMLRTFWHQRATSRPSGGGKSGAST